MPRRRPARREVACRAPVPRIGSTATPGVYPLRSDDGGAAVVNYYGAVRTFAFSTNMLQGLANGKTINVRQDAALFSLLGASYGGDGRNTFALPNLAGPTVVGNVSGRYPGQVSGSAGTTLTQANLPAHDHDLAGGASTGVSGTGSPMPLDNRQPSLALNYGIAVDGLYGGSGDRAAIGEVRAFAGAFVPGGYMEADGRELTIANYSALYDILGTTYGGDGVTTFRLPDLARRAVVGASNNAAGAGTAVADVGLGETIGSETTTLTAANLPAHAHQVPGSTTPTASEGAGGPIAQEQPSLGLNYMIALEGIYPSFNSVPAESTMLGEVSAFAGAISALPRGWALADGRLLAINQNMALFSLLGTTYGGDGQRTFALPDLRGRTVVGVGQANGVNYTVGQQLGTSRLSLEAVDLPAHIHSLPEPVAAPVPEPATWGLMLAGFGVVGAGLRSRRRRAAVTFA